MRAPDKALRAAYFLWALLLPWSLAAMQIALGLVVAVTLLVIWQRRDLRPGNAPFFIMLGVYLLLAILSALIGPQPQHSLRALLDTEWPLLTLPLLALVEISGKDCKKILGVLIFSASVLSIYTFYQFFSGWDPIRGHGLAPIGR